MRRSVTAVSLMMVFATMLFAAGCGGGGGSTPAVSTGDSIGRIQAKVYFPGRSADRVASVATETITVEIAITGYYSEDGTEFDPVNATLDIDLSQGYGTVSVLQVPIGTNHLMTAVAEWSDGYTQTIKAIIPSVAEGVTTSATANPRSTAIAEAAIQAALDKGITLNLISSTTIENIGSAVDYYYGQGTDYTSISATQVESFLTPYSATITPRTATLNVGATQQFVAVVYNSLEQALTDYTWSVSGGIGTISDTGLFTATAAGSGAVTVTSGDVTASATITTLSTSSDTGCSDTALSNVTTAKSYLFKSSLSAADVASAEAELDTALATSPNCPDANLLSGIVDIANEADRVSTNVLADGSTIFPVDTGYTLPESLSKLTTPVLKSLPRTANLLSENSAPSEYQSEIITNSLAVLSGALAKLEIVRTAVALDSTWAFSYPKDPDYPDLGNETLDSNDIDVLTGTLKLQLGIIYYILSYNLDPPANYETFDPCPEMTISGYEVVNGFTVPVFATDTSVSALTKSNMCPYADTDGNGVLTPDEYLPPSPFGTLTSSGASYLDSAQTYISAGLGILATAVDAILAETESTVGGVPLATTLIADAQQYKHFVSELAASFGGTATTLTHPDEVQCWKENTLYAGSYSSSYIVDSSYNADKLAECTAYFTTSPEININVNFGALFDVADFRDILFDMTIDSDGDSEVSSGLINDTMGGLFPSGVQSSWFEYSEAHLYLSVGMLVDSQGNQLMPTYDTVVTATIDGITITQCYVNDYYNYRVSSQVYYYEQLYCSYYPQNGLPTASDYFTVNEMFGTPLTLSIAGYEDVTLTVYDTYAPVGTLELTPTAQ